MTYNGGAQRIVQSGTSLPLGARPTQGGVNFSIFSRNCVGVTLLLFRSPNDEEPEFAVELDPEKNRTGDIWHIWVAGAGPGQCYAYRVKGPYLPEEGLRYNPCRILVDPYAKILTGVSTWDFERALGYDPASPAKDLVPSLADNGGGAAKSLVMGRSNFDWSDVAPPKHPWSKTVIYETHVRGLTIHGSSGVKQPGTYQGLIEKIPYFKELGITAVELMPVQEFNENERTRNNPPGGGRLRNFWGYNPVAFFAPKESYSIGSEPGHQVRAFQEMVRALHGAGIEVILDVVFNHTAEMDELGPTLSLRGLDNPVYYMLKKDKRYYQDFSGCLNTMNCAHPVVADLILDCLRHWVIEMRVDGFRFDLASILARDQDGAIVSNAPLLRRIEEDPVLRGVKLIAEPWDAAGAFQVGGFFGSRWSEWNAHYRDDVRRFWRGDPGMAGALASRLSGSSDLYGKPGKQPRNGINFITCHDGFTLNDLVSYNHKHNEANGQNNQDGTGLNYSHNYGVEGETEDPEIEAIRVRQIKNMLATLLLSRGVPMLLGGDEFRRTQRGNNNAYCQDNPTSWYDWTLLESNKELFRFTRELIAFRGRHASLSANRFYREEEVLWFNHSGRPPDWHAADRTLGCIIHAADEETGCLCLLFNAESREVEFRIPTPADSQTWQVAIDTAAPSPVDIRSPGSSRPIADPRRLLRPSRSLAVLSSMKL